MEAPSPYVVQSFVRSTQDVDSDAVADIAHKRWKAEVFESADLQDLSLPAQEQAADTTVKAWYSQLSDEEDLHWRYYYNRRFSPRHDGEVPDEVTSLLEEAVERDCFQSFKIRRHEQQFVLLGYRRESKACVPIAAWHPEDSPLPDPDQLREHYEAAKAEEVESNAAAAKRERERAADAQREHNRLRSIARIYWGVALVLLGTILVLFYLTIGGWVSIPATVILLCAWFIRQDSRIHYGSDLWRTLTRPLLTLSVVAMIGLGGTWLQFGTVTEKLTLCDSSSMRDSTYETPEGDEYTVGVDAYGDLIGSTDAMASAVKVVAEVRQNTFFGNPEVMSARVVGDGYEACFNK